MGGEGRGEGADTMKERGLHAVESWGGQPCSEGAVKRDAWSSREGGMQMTHLIFKKADGVDRNSTLMKGVGKHAMPAVPPARLQLVLAPALPFAFFGSCPAVFTVASLALLY